MYAIWENDIIWCWRRDEGWTIFSQCEDPDISECKTTPFLAVTLICETVQAEVIRIQFPEIGSYDWEVYDPDINN